MTTWLCCDVITFNDVLFVIMFLIYFKLAVDFGASLGQQKRRHRRSGKWMQDE